MRSLESRLPTVVLPADVRIAYGGDAEGSGEANSALLRTLPVALMLLLGVLLAEFNSFRRVAIILVTVPLAATGVVPGLLLSGQPFGFMSLLGVFALVGIVVNNAIVLLDLINQLRERGMDRMSAIKEGARLRLRPIMMTTLTTVLGLAPMALGIGQGAEMRTPMAITVIGGLLTSTLLTLLVVPVMYSLLDRRRDTTAAEPDSGARVET